MNITKLLLAGVFAFATSVGFAADAKQTCCEKAKAAGKECSHPCCVAAVKDGKVCEKCNPPKKEEKK
jgi:hypothetical protein